MSQFNLIYEGIDVSSYATGVMQILFYQRDHKDATGATQPLFVSSLVQSRSYFNVQWSITTLDLILGIIGGSTGLIIQVLGWTIGGY